MRQVEQLKNNCLKVLELHRGILGLTEDEHMREFEQALDKWQNEFMP